MKKKMMMLLTTVALVMGLTACGDSTASTGNDDYVAPSLVVEGSSEATPTTEPTPEVTAEPTAEPAPVYTEVTVRDIQRLSKDVNGTEMSFPLIDGELPDTSLTLAEMWFHVPEGMSVSWEDIDENRYILFGISHYNIPGGEHWMNDTLAIADKYLTARKTTDYALKDDWTGDFDKGMTREQWESMFTLTRVKKTDPDYNKSYWSNQIEVKTTNEEQQALFAELVNTYTYTEALDILAQAKDWATVPDEYRKYCFLADSIFATIVRYNAEFEAAFKAYTADPTGWVDTYAEFKQQ